MLTNVSLLPNIHMEKDSKDIPELLTLHEACEALKCHPNTLRQWDNKGILKAVRIGARGDRKYRKTDIVALLEKK